MVGSAWIEIRSQRNEGIPLLRRGRNREVKCPSREESDHRQASAKSGLQVRTSAMTDDQLVESQLPRSCQDYPPDPLGGADRHRRRVNDRRSEPANEALLVEPGYRLDQAQGRRHVAQQPKKDFIHRVSREQDGTEALVGRKWSLLIDGSSKPSVRRRLEIPGSNGRIVPQPFSTGIFAEICERRRF